MLNQTVIVGRIVKEPELIENETGKKVSNLTIAVPRSYKNKDGKYDTDFIDCTLWSGLAENTVEYCKKGDLVGVKGRIETDFYEREDGSTVKNTKVVAEKVTFLSSKK
ncbi:MAG: single-stranded DNA-binding protein [Ignavibacteriales bacterium]